jgi:hypothetical protein
MEMAEGSVGMRLFRILILQLENCWPLLWIGKMPGQFFTLECRLHLYETIVLKEMKKKATKS